MAGIVRRGCDENDRSNVTQAKTHHSSHLEPSVAENLPEIARLG